MQVSFLIPAYNEGGTIGAVIERVQALAFDKQLIVIDDGSTDDTARIVRSSQPRVTTSRSFSSKTAARALRSGSVSRTSRVTWS